MSNIGLLGYSGDDEVWEGISEDTLTKTKIVLADMYKRRIDMAGVFSSSTLADTL